MESLHLARQAALLGGLVVQPFFRTLMDDLNLNKIPNSPLIPSSSLPPKTIKNSNKRPLDEGDLEVPANKSVTFSPILPTFLIIHSPSQELKNISPFAINKGIKGICGEVNLIKRLRSGDILIETKNYRQSQSLMNMEKFVDITVNVSPHRSLNTSRGVISEIDLLNVSDEEIREELADQNVIDSRRITIRKGLEIVKTKHIILTFNTPKLPIAIHAGYLNCPVRPYIPNPLRCFNCQRFGHSQTSCRGSATCAKCGTTEHASEDCGNEAKCINCGGDHPAYSRSCPKWQSEKEIQQIKITKNVSFPEARALAALTTPKPNLSYATVVKPKSVKTMSSQTEITIPPSNIHTVEEIKNKLTSIPSTSKITGKSSQSSRINVKRQDSMSSTSKKTSVNQKQEKLDDKQLKSNKTSSGHTKPVDEKSDVGDMEVDSGLEFPKALLPRPTKAQWRKSKHNNNG